MNHNILVGTTCLICGEVIYVPHIPSKQHVVICDKCKAAVMYIREQLERDPCTPILD